MALQFVTTNAGKFVSIQRIFNRYSVHIEQTIHDIPELQAERVETIAEHKAHRAFKHIQAPCMVQDSGFYIHAWNGFPGPYIKYVLDTIGVIGLLELNNKNALDCEFREAHAYFDGRILKVFSASIPGIMVSAPRGEQKSNAWSDLWLVFQPDGYDKTIAEMSEKEREEWPAARNGNAAAKCARWLARRM